MLKGPNDQGIVADHEGLARQSMAANSAADTWMVVAVSVLTIDRACCAAFASFFFR
jgi:hypothetical protein